MVFRSQAVLDNEYTCLRHTREVGGQGAVRINRTNDIGAAVKVHDHSLRGCAGRGDPLGAHPLYVARLIFDMSLLWDERYSGLDLCTLLLNRAGLVPQALHDPQRELNEMALPACHDITNLFLFHIEAMERPFLLALRRICERFAINKTNSTDISAYHISARRENGNVTSRTMDSYCLPHAYNTILACRGDTLPVGRPCQRMRHIGRSTISEDDILCDCIPYTRGMINACGGNKLAIG